VAKGLGCKEFGGEGRWWGCLEDRVYIVTTLGGDALYSLESLDFSAAAAHLFLGCKVASVQVRFRQREYFTVTSHI
jgi:hypothetical protein